MAQKSAMKGVPFTLQNAQTTGNGLVIAIPNSFRYHQIVIKGNGAVGAGAIQVECADDPAYAGTWAPLGGGPVTVVANAEVVVNLTGIISFLRARISTNITVGTVTVSYIGS